jgi:hypothetical protein
MKLFFGVLILLGKLYMGLKIMWWAFSEIRFPEQHSFSEIEVFFVLLVFDIWMTGQSSFLENYQDKKEN